MKKATILALAALLLAALIVSAHGYMSDSETGAAAMYTKEIFGATPAEPTIPTTRMTTTTTNCIERRPFYPALWLPQRAIRLS